MANNEHVKMLKKSVTDFNKWREENLESWPDLSGANLIGAYLIGAYLSEANLKGANLNEANLIGANLSEANLSRANLIEANLIGANLIGANLSRTNLIGANLIGTNLNRANLSEANLSRATINLATLVETNLEGANISNSRIYGISAWNIKLSQETKQFNLTITQTDEPVITVDSLEVAQFVNLLLNNVKIHDIINTITTKTVLILGRFTKKREVVLDAIRDELRKHDYVPILFDFKKSSNRDLHETITTLARMARFVIADITNPNSIPQELTSIVEQLPSLPVQPLLRCGTKPWAMYDHISRYPWVLPIFKYRNIDELIASLKDKVILPAENEAMKSE